eukprot:jgi/Chlat1/7007/Chrsp56S06687
MFTKRARVLISQTQRNAALMLLPVIESTATTASAHQQARRQLEEDQVQQLQQLLTKLQQDQQVQQHEEKAGKGKQEVKEESAKAGEQASAAAEVAVVDTAVFEPERKEQQQEEAAEDEQQSAMQIIADEDEEAALAMSEEWEDDSVVDEAEDEAASVEEANDEEDDVAEEGEGVLQPSALLSIGAHMQPLTTILDVFVPTRTESIQQQPAEEKATSSSKSSSKQSISSDPNICLGAELPWMPEFITNKGRRLLDFSYEYTGLDEDELDDEDVFDDFSNDNEEDGTSRGKTLKSWCRGEAGQERTLTSDERLLLACLQDESECTSDKRASIAKAANNLKGMQMLQKRTNCFGVTSKGECSSVSGNPETSTQGGTFRRRPGKDFNFRDRIPTCALVANGPLVKISENGKAIDKHDAVWRFNLVSMKAYKPWVGSKTDFRYLKNSVWPHKLLVGVFNRLRSYEVSGTRKGVRTSIRPSKKGEQWLFWNYRSVKYLDVIHRRFPTVDVRLLAPDLLEWLVESYFQLREDLMSLGYKKRFSCPENLSGGIHALFMALQTCQQVNLFGYSYSAQVMKDRPGHIARRISICTRDVPGKAIRELRGLKD